MKRKCLEGNHKKFQKKKLQKHYSHDDPEKRRLTYMKAREFDKKFDKGEDISKYLDVST
jgi:ribosomal protein S4